MNHRTALADWLGDMVAGDREREVADHILAGTALDAAAAHWVSEYPPRCEHPRGHHHRGPRAESARHRWQNGWRLDMFDDDIPF